MAHLRSPLFYLTKKEFIQLFRDKRLVFLLFFYPVLQLLIFGYVFQTEVKHISMGVLDRSKTSESRALVNAFKSAGYLEITSYPESRSSLLDGLEHGHIQAGIVIPDRFADELARGGAPEIQVLVDGSDPNTGGTALSYITRIVQARSARRIAVNPRAVAGKSVV